MLPSLYSSTSKAESIKSSILFFSCIILLSSKLCCKMDKAQSFGWLNPCSQSKDSRTSMFVPIIASNLRDVLHITKTVPNYTHLMWVPWLNFVQLEASAWWRIAYKNCMSGLPLSGKFPKSGAAVIDLWLWWKTWCGRAADLHWPDFMILQTLYLESMLWPCCSLQRTVKRSTVSQSDSATEWH